MIETQKTNIVLAETQTEALALQWYVNMNRPAAKSKISISRPQYIGHN